MDPVGKGDDLPPYTNLPDGRWKVDTSQWTVRNLNSFTWTFTALIVVYSYLVFIGNGPRYRPWLFQAYLGDTFCQLQCFSRLPLAVVYNSVRIAEALTYLLLPVLLGLVIASIYYITRPPPL